MRLVDDEGRVRTTRLERVAVDIRMEVFLFFLHICTQRMKTWHGTVSAATERGGGGTLFSYKRKAQHASERKDKELQSNLFF